MKREVLGKHSLSMGTASSTVSCEDGESTIAANKEEQIARWRKPKSAKRDEHKPQQKLSMSMYKG